jgi:hypothetical protein
VAVQGEIIPRLTELRGAGVATSSSSSDVMRLDNTIGYLQSANSLHGPSLSTQCTM